jgi:MFS family permease
MRRIIVVAAVGTTQTLAWGSSYYLPAILAEPIAEGLGLSRTMVFGVFSGSLLLSALLGPAVGRAIDNRGGRGVLVLSNVVLAAGLVLLAVAQGGIGLAVAWAALGAGMALGASTGGRHAAQSRELPSLPGSRARSVGRSQLFSSQIGAGVAPA